MNDSSRFALKSRLSNSDGVRPRARPTFDPQTNRAICGKSIAPDPGGTASRRGGAQGGDPHQEARRAKASESGKTKLSW
jgi:hypothetical protein